jgi:hypothetical protein
MNYCPIVHGLNEYKLNHSSQDTTNCIENSETSSVPLQRPYIQVSNNEYATKQPDSIHGKCPKITKNLYFLSKSCTGQ